MEVKFRGCFSQVQQVKLKNKIMCTSPGYLSIDTKKKNQKISHAHNGDKKFAAKLKKKNSFIGHSPPWVKVAIWGHTYLCTHLFLIQPPIQISCHIKLIIFPVSMSRPDESNSDLGGPVCRLTSVGNCSVCQWPGQLFAVHVKKD